MQYNESYDQKLLQRSPIYVSLFRMWQGFFIEFCQKRLPAKCINHFYKSMKYSNNCLILQIMLQKQTWNSSKYNVVLLYSRTSQLTEVNEARKHLFFYCNWKLENILSSSAALLQHVKREAFQAGTEGQSNSSMSFWVRVETWQWRNLGALMEYPHRSIKGLQRTHHVFL